MKRTYVLVISSAITITVFIVLTLMQAPSVPSGPQAAIPTPAYGLDTNATNVLPNMSAAVQPKITGLAPDISYEDKPAVVIRHSDGSLEEYLLAPETVNAFLDNLPEGDKLELKMPPASAMLTHEAP